MNLPAIDHALVTDTDHIPGRGGYALVSASPGVTQAERRFVADNLGISDYLHARANARMYFSFFPVPNGRYAFVRRFASGTRRNGVQNRLFVHTLFLDDDAFQALHGLPWLLAEMSVRPEGSRDSIPMARVIDPLQSDPEMPALEWEKPSTAEAHALLLRRMDALAAFSASSGSLAVLPAKESIARAASALGRSARLLLPQGPAFELLTLLTWSILPVPDRAAMAWTQHDEARAAGTDFRLSNVPEPETAVDFAVASIEVARRTVDINETSVASWMEFADETRSHDLRWGNPDIHAWLEYREYLAALISDPMASDTVLLPRLTMVAKSVRPDRKDWWVGERTIRDFVWTNIIRSIEQDSPAGLAIERWGRLAVQSKIGLVAFRDPPSFDWLDERATQVGADLLVHFFLQVTESTADTAAAREAIARWVLQRKNEMRVTSDPLARLAVSLAIDRAALLVDVLAILLARADGFQALKSAIPDVDPRLSDAILLAILTGLRTNHRDTSFFAREVFLRQLEQNPEIGRDLSGATAVSIGESLRGDSASFIKFAFFLPDATLTRVVMTVDSWIGQDARKWRPLGRLILQRAQAETRASTAFARLAFTAAAHEEKSEIWLPMMIRVAKALDRTAQSATKAAFAEKVTSLERRFAAEPAAAETLLNAIRDHVSLGGVGTSLRSLLMASRVAWPRVRRVAAQTIEAIVNSPFHPAVEWESCVLAFMDRPDAGGPERAALARFWHKVKAHDVEKVSSAAIASIHALRDGARKTLVKAWTPRLRSVRVSEQADALIAVLRAIAVPELEPGLEIEIALREIGRHIDTMETYTRLDLALLTSNPKKRVQNLVGAIERRLRGAAPAQHVSWLMNLFAAPGTPVITQQVIEDQLLPAALRELTPAQWLDAIELGKESLFVFDYFLVGICRRAVAAKAYEAAHVLYDESAERKRSAGIDALVVASKGKLLTRTAAEGSLGHGAI